MGHPGTGGCRYVRSLFRLAGLLAVWATLALCSSSSLANSGAVRVGDEVHVVGLRGVQGGLERGDSGVADRARRKAGVGVGVVGGVRVQLALVNDAGPGAVQQRGINHGGVGLQRHAGPQAVLEDAGDDGPLGRHMDLALDERGHGDDPVASAGSMRRRVATSAKRLTMAPSIWTSVVWRLNL